MVLGPPEASNWRNWCRVKCRNCCVLIPDGLEANSWRNTNIFISEARRQLCCPKWPNLQQLFRWHGINCGNDSTQTSPRNLCSNKSQKSLGGGFGGAARREIVGIDSDGCSRKKWYGREKYTQAEKVKCECGKIEVMVFRKEGGKGQRGAGGNLIVNRRGGKV